MDHDLASPPEIRPTPYSVWCVPGGVVAVHMPAEIDFTVCGQVHAALMHAVESGAAVVVADLTGTRFCGYTAAATLVNAHVRAAEAGTRLRVAASAPQARLIGRIAGAGHRLDFYPTLIAALAGPRSHAAARTGHRFRLIQGGGTGSSLGEPARRLSLAPPASQTPPPAPSGL